MQKFYIVTGIALMWIVASGSTAAWILHMEKMIKPGDSVTITCANPQVEPDITECADGELVVSPTTCTVPGFN